jgi:hypothetical protein
MQLRMISLRRQVGLASVLLALVPLLILLPSRQAAAAHGDCTLSISGPFFYAGMVAPFIEVTCDSIKQSIRIDAALDRDGSEVATASRTCRKARSCWIGLARDGIFAQDIPGDQLWCGHGSAFIHTTGPGHSLPEATSCESDTF